MTVTVAVVVGSELGPAGYTEDCVTHPVVAVEVVVNGHSTTVPITPVETTSQGWWRIVWVVGVAQLVTVSVTVAAWTTPADPMRK